MTFELLERANDVENHIGNLENRHNIIHHGTQYGKVLALQTLYKADVPSPFEPYTRYLGEDHCIVSTLIADRFEELLTSEHYMNFFFDLSLPKGGYFRLVIAREPKDFEALSVYATLSKKLAYQTAILPYPRWENTVKEALRAVLDPKTFMGVIQLIEGQTELGIASSTLDSLDSLSPSGSNFLGRIQKDRKVEGFSKRHLKRGNAARSRVVIHSSSARLFWLPMSPWCRRITPPKADQRLT